MTRRVDMRGVGRNDAFMTRIDGLVGIGDAAKHVGLSPATLRRYVESGHLAAVRLPSGRLRFRTSDLDSLLTPSRQLPPTSPARSTDEPALFSGTARNARVAS